MFTLDNGRKKYQELKKVINIEEKNIIKKRYGRGFEPLFKNEEAMYVVICANTAVAEITHKQHNLYC